MTLKKKPFNSREQETVANFNTLVKAFGSHPLPPGKYIVVMHHDPWCSRKQDLNTCNCNQDIEIMDKPTFRAFLEKKKANPKDDPTDLIITGSPQ